MPRVNRWRMLLALGAAAVLLYAVLQAHINLGQTLSLLRKTNWLAYLAAIAVFYLSSVIRAGRWKLLLRNAGQHAGLLKAWRILMLGWFVNGIFPAKPGDIYRARLLGKAYQTSASKAFGTIAMERLLDGAVLLVLIDVLGLALFRQRMPALFGAALMATGGVMLLAVLAVTLLRRFRPNGMRVPARAAPIFERFRAGLVGSVSNVPLLLGITTFLWLLEGVRLYLVVRALPVPVLSWAQLTFTALAGSLLTAFPGLPGGLSLVEGGMVTVLVYFGLTVSVGLSVALLDRLINYWSVLVMSLLAFGLAAAIHVVRLPGSRPTAVPAIAAGPSSPRQSSPAARRLEWQRTPSPLSGG